MRKTWSVLLAAVLATSSVPLLTATPAAADPGPRPEVTKVRPLGISQPLSALGRQTVRTPQAPRSDVIPSPRKPSSPDRIAAIIANGGGPPVTAQPPLPGLEMPGVLDQFEGINNRNGVQPPDTVGDVGPDHYVQMVNLSIQVFDKNGTPAGPAVDSNQVWQAGGGACATTNSGDPIVLYDQFADRWILSQFSIPDSVDFEAPFYECVAVSQTGDPTGAYFLYSFEYQALPDYPKLGVWTNAYLVSYNMFAAKTLNYLGHRICAWDRAAMLAGQTVTELCYDLVQEVSTLPADIDGSTPPPAGSPGYFVGLPWSENDHLTMYRLTPDFTNPAASVLNGPIRIPVAEFTFACAAVSRGKCIPQPQTETSARLESLGDRMMYRLAYRNFGDHESLVTNHTVAMDGDLGFTRQTGLKWYELRNLAAPVPQVYQEGVAADVDGVTFRWMGSTAMDRSGNMAIGYSTSGLAAGSFPSIRYAGRRNTDPLNQMPQAESLIIAGTGVQESQYGRWGDYSSMNVDPVDDCTFWYTTEYIQTSGDSDWQTRVASFRYPSCGKEATAPTSVSGVSGPGSVAVSFAAATGPAGFPVQSYVVTASPGGAQCTTTGLSCTVTGLTNGQPYTFTAVAVNEAGNSPASAPSAPVVPLSVPSAPVGVTASVAGTPGAADVAWLAPDSNGGLSITGYKVSASPGGQTCTTTGTSCTISGLRAGGTYTFAVVASNALGDGPAGVSAAVSLAKNNQTAKVSLPKKIRFDGKTTLLKKTVGTNAGQKAKVRVTVRPKGKKYAKVTKSKKGKVVIQTKGERRLRVRLTLTAPATPEFNAYSKVKRWRVKK